MNSEVYTWRVSTTLKADLEREARRQQLPLSKALDLAARQWLEKTSTEQDSGERQAQLQAATLRTIGAFASGQTNRAESASRLVQERLQRRPAR